MCQFSKVILAIDNVYTVPQRALDCGPGLGGIGHKLCHRNRTMCSVIEIGLCALSWEYGHVLCDKYSLVLS